MALESDSGPIKDKKTGWTHWLPLVVLLLAIFIIEANKNGLLQTYIRASSYLIFALSISGVYYAYKLTVFASQNESKIGLQVKRLFYQIEGFPAPVVSVIVLLKYPIILGGWFALYVMLFKGHQSLLFALSGYPEHVLFPCSDEILWTDDLKEEALRFWKMQWFSDFECDRDYYVEDKW